MARLLVLWLLSEHPMYGYQIKKALSDEGIAFWFSLEDASIYSVLRTLAKNGKAEALPVEQPGKRPPRTQYRITADGRRYYRELLATALATPSLPVGPIDVALAAQGDLEATVITESLGVRSKELEALETKILGMRRAAPTTAIVDRNLAIIRAEQAWLQELDHSTIT